MFSMMVTHKVKDFDKWHGMFEEDSVGRKEAGSLGATLFQSPGDPNEIHVLMKFSDKDSAQAMMQSPKLKEVISKIS